MAVALITGASSGIGEQFAYALARERYPLALTARREERLQAVAEQAQKLGAPAAHIFVLDLARHSAPAELHDQVRWAGLEIEMLVNNAGFGARGRFDRLPLERELEQVDVNIRALVALTRLFLPAMISARRGTIINLASTAGFQAVPYMATYAATKSFVVNFSLALNRELRETGVHVMALCPGATRTEFQSVAGTDGTMPSFVYMDAQTVVAQALRAARKNRAIRINGALNVIATGSQRPAPRWLGAPIAAMFFRPPGLIKGR